ncbi:hypothetical protein [Clostridium minihomine]|uniref:hypothetical protein n=1 Tax=Clostridium minihomine TaxID=2045012 RepID=UPI000C77C1D5|nr:hypothetical protein [Clostridium minihomine]
MPESKDSMTIPIVFRCDPKIKEAAKKAAKADNRSLSSYMLKLLVEDLAKTGFTEIKVTSRNPERESLDSDSLLEKMKHNF